MGKKNKKFKKSKSQQVQTVQKEAIISSNNQAVMMDQNPTTVDEAKPEVAPDEITVLNEKYKYVRKDITKLMIVIAVLIILFVGAYILGIKTNILTSIGDWIYKVGNFQIQ